MELANGGSLEDYIQIQWNPASSAFTAPESLRQKRRQSKSLWPPDTLCTNTLKSIQDTLEDPFMCGGIGTHNGVKVRYLLSEEIKHLFTDICLGLNHLHSQGIIHRDLKPPNLLLSFDKKSGIPSVLISDFGECEVLSDHEYHERTGATGTLEFMPPELLIKDERGNYLSNHSPSADIWSLGVVLYYLCYSTVPFSQVDDIETLGREILAFKSPSFVSCPRVSSFYQSLMVQLMNPKPDLRPTISQVLSQLSL